MLNDTPTTPLALVSDDSKTKPMSARAGRDLARRMMAEGKRGVDINRELAKHGTRPLSNPTLSKIRRELGLQGKRGKRVPRARAGAAPTSLDAAIDTLLTYMRQQNFALLTLHVSGSVKGERLQTENLR